ncbi:hypothetical protein ZWY2020_013049 [Hordeum vulgare]|nr:hypothetical protein ZWY2020_013049 [Hordeum vulgare]
MARHPTLFSTTTHCEVSYTHGTDTQMACVFFFDAEPVGEPGVHALDACALCRSRWRGTATSSCTEDTPFCSDECRQEQMRLDAACARRAAARRQKQFSSGTGRACTPSLGGVRCELAGDVRTSFEPAGPACMEPPSPVAN